MCTQCTQDSYNLITASVRVGSLKLTKHAIWEPRLLAPGVTRTAIPARRVFFGEAGRSLLVAAYSVGAPSFS